MKKLLNSLTVFSLTLGSVNQISAFTIKNNENLLSVDDKFSIKISTSNFEVDNKNELLPNKSYDRKKEMQQSLVKWQEYKKENNIVELNIEQLEAKFGALDSSGENIDNNFYKKLLISDNVEIQKLNFYIYDKVDAQYKIDFIGDFIIDNIEYKNVSLSGYEENQYFTSWQILSDFFIITEYEVLDLIKFSNNDIFNLDLDLGENDSQTMYVKTLSEYKNYFNKNPKEKLKIVKPYWSLTNIKTKEEYIIDAMLYKTDDRVFLEDTYNTMIAVRLMKDKPGVETNVLGLSWLTVFPSPGPLGNSRLIRKYKSDTFKGNFEVSLKVALKR
ncbi:hypothetical protein [Spiroplasma cantharicola]|uniref:Uncharacterized protein n=1 Tax=Spiroplasma cantharicola TaxID=362837 RepID=A0A0M5KCE7_9MOLU|nr:hypothetical protein [Spiroplasma cantharicola]ALD66543.1 hypothetical protein SCANT_v1c06370 [Spiroplasma cantharicola]